MAAPLARAEAVRAIQYRSPCKPRAASRTASRCTNCALVRPGSVRRRRAQFAHDGRGERAGRQRKLDALVGAVREIGQHLGEATPNMDALMGLTRLMGQMRGLYPEPTKTPQ